eukprot:COSAG03_NODE_439_length_7918_cov_13.498785_11_plen_81_part_00
MSLVGAAKRRCVHQLGRKPLEHPVWIGFDWPDRLPAHGQAEPPDSHLSCTERAALRYQSARHATPTVDRSCAWWQRLAQH